jgi:hypothetical protein
LARCIDLAELTAEDRVVDPFAGVGTAGINVLEGGARFSGIEAHPLVAELAQLKFSDPPDIADVRHAADDIADSSGTWTCDAEPELVRACFETSVLEVLIGLRQSIHIQDSTVQPYLKWALLGALRDCANKKVGWPHQRPGVSRTPRISDPKRAFLRRIDWMSTDLAGWKPGGQARVVRGDSRRDDSWDEALKGELASVCITSPPYLNNFDYGDATRLEMYFWGVASSWADLRRLTHSVMVSSSTQQTTKPAAADAWVQLSRQAPQTAAQIAPTIESLTAFRRDRSGRKEFDRLLPLYFVGIAEVLTRLAKHSRAGAPVILVLGDSAPYGVHVDTPNLVSLLATELGFNAVQSDAIRRRGLRWVTNGSRHSVPLSESLVVLASPGPNGA